MKKIIFAAIMLIGMFVQAQTTVHNSKVKIKDIQVATGLDTLVLVASPDGEIKSMNISDIVNNVTDNSGTDDQTATEVPFTPYSSIGSVDTQSAIQELKDELDAGIGSPAETDPIYSAWNKSSGITITESQISDLTHTIDTDTQLNESEVDAMVANNGYITSTPAETDPVFSAWDKSGGITITESQISDLTHTINTDTQLSESEVDAFVSNNGYLTSESAETDPVFGGSPAANTTGTNTGDQDLTPYELKTLRVELPAGAYTTNDADVGKEITLTSGSVITLDDANVSVDYDVTFFNNTGGTITFAFGSGDTAIQGAPNDLEHGQYGYASLKAANTWSVMVGGTSSSGSTTISELSDVALSAPTLNDVIAYDGTKWINQAIPGATETDPVFAAWNKSTGISITESQISDLNHTTDTNLTESEVDAMVANNGYITSAGSDDQTAIEVPFTPSGNTTSSNVQSAIQELQTEINGIGGAGAETDPVFAAWDKSTGITITESQISNLNHAVNTDDQNAGEVSYNSSGQPWLNASNVQDVIAELYDETVRLEPTSGSVDFIHAANDDEFRINFKSGVQTQTYFESTTGLFEMYFPTMFRMRVNNEIVATSSSNEAGGRSLSIPNNTFDKVFYQSTGTLRPGMAIESYVAQMNYSPKSSSSSMGNPTTSTTWKPTYQRNNEFFDVFVSSPITITLDKNGNIYGKQVRFLQESTGTITFAAGTGVTLLAPNGLSTSGVGQIATVLFYWKDKAVVTITK